MCIASIDIHAKVLLQSYPLSSWQWDDGKGGNHITLPCWVQTEEDSEGSKAARKGFLSEVFGGQLSSRVACEVCHHTSVTLEPFMDLSLPVPSAALADPDESTPDRSDATCLHCFKNGATWTPHCCL